MTRLPKTFRFWTLWVKLLLLASSTSQHAWQPNWSKHWKIICHGKLKKKKKCFLSFEFFIKILSLCSSYLLSCISGKKKTRRLRQTCREHGGKKRKVSLVKPLGSMLPSRISWPQRLCSSFIISSCIEDALRLLIR